MNNKESPSELMALITRFTSCGFLLSSEDLDNLMVEFDEWVMAPTCFLFFFKGVAEGRLVSESGPLNTSTLPVSTIAAKTDSF